MKFNDADIITIDVPGIIPSLIRWRTGGPAHVGIVSDELVYESTTFSKIPCEINHRIVNGVMAHLPQDIISSAVESGGKASIYRLVPEWKLDARESRILNNFLRVKIGTPYDYEGAFTSGTIFRFLPWAKWPDHSLFCSELVAEALKRIMRFSLANTTTFSPHGLIREIMKTGLYERIYEAVS